VVRDDRNGTPRGRDLSAEDAHETPRRRRAVTWRNGRRLRRLVQLGTLAFFVYLLFAALQHKVAFPLADLFFRFDPLAALATMLAARQWLGHLALALATVAATIVLGRVWCGWVCPLGTVLEYTPFKGARRRARRLPPRLRDGKYVLLIVIVAMAALGSMTLMVLDPLSLLTRTMTTSIIPGFDFAVTKLETGMLHIGFLQPVVNLIEAHLRGNVLPVIQPLYTQAVFLALLFLGVIALNALADRFWCRYLCPLGGLLGLLSKIAVLRPVVRDACTRCNRCAAACKLAAIEPAGAPARAAGHGSAALATPPTVIGSECTMCLDCLVACPTATSMSYGLDLRPGPWASYDPGRKQFVTALAGGVGAVVLLGTGVWHRQRDSRLIRPPGSQDESTFLAHCLRCSQCMKVCPTSGLQPALDEGGLEGIWTPVLKPRLGYCDYGCNACGHTCPSGAIPRLSLDTKRKQVLGVAVIDRDRCLPWAQDTPCIVCQEMCPVPKKAIELTKGKLVKNAQGFENWVTKPLVVADLCIGCGICEYRCPVEGRAAIVVVAGKGIGTSGAAPGAVQG